MNAPVIINHAQQSAEWHAHRVSHFNASDAPAMLNISPYMSRSALLERYARGLPEEIDAQTQTRFDRGHEYEAQARPWAEEILDEDLYPVTMAREIDGLKLSASLDGITLDGEVVWEHKTRNAMLADSLAQGEIPERYKPQLEQQLLVSGAGRVLFMCSSGNPDSVEKAWYESDPAMRARLLAGWQQFKRDLDNYTPSNATPAPVATPIQALPALLVEIEGRVVSTNLDRFQAAAKSLIGAIKTDLSTDQDFADAEATVKFCKDAESRLETVKAQALAQTASIDEVFRVMDGLKEELRAKRLHLEKAVKVRKDEVRAELITDAMEQILQHARILEADMGAHWLNVPARQTLGEAIKGRKSVSSCRDALSVKVGLVCAELRDQADNLTRNRKALHRDGRDWYSLFPDFETVGLRDAEEFDALADFRIRKHQEAEAEAARLKAEALERARAERAAEAARQEAARQAAETQAQAKAQPQAVPGNHFADAANMVSADDEAPVELTPDNLKSTLDHMLSAIRQPEQEQGTTGAPVKYWDAEIAAFMALHQFGHDEARIKAILYDFAEFISNTNQ